MSNFTHTARPRARTRSTNKFLFTKWNLRELVTNLSRMFEIKINFIIFVLMYQCADYKRESTWNLWPNSCGPDVTVDVVTELFNQSTYVYAIQHKRYNEFTSSKSLRHLTYHCFWQFIIKMSVLYTRKKKKPLLTSFSVSQRKTVSA